MRKSGILVVLFLLLTSSVFAQDVQPFELDEEATLMAATPEELETVIVTFISSDGELKSLRLQVLKEAAVPSGEYQREVVTTSAPRRVPVTTTPEPEPSATLANTTIIYYKDDRCSLGDDTPTTVTFPDREKVQCVAREARLAINRMRLVPEPETPCFYFFGSMYENCMEIPAKAELKVNFGMSPRYIKGLLQGKLWSGCAAGISATNGNSPIFVSLQDSSRSLPLVGWEAGNTFIYVYLGLIEETDGPLVGQATQEALVACKVVQ